MERYEIVCGRILRIAESAEEAEEMAVELEDQYPGTMVFVHKFIEEDASEFYYQEKTERVDGIE